MHRASHPPCLRETEGALRLPLTQLLRLEGLARTVWPHARPLGSPAADNSLSSEGLRAGGGQRGEGAARLGAGKDWAGAGRPQGGLAVSVCPHGALWREGLRSGHPTPRPCPSGPPHSRVLEFPAEGTILPGNESPALPQSFPHWSAGGKQPET